MLSAFPKTSLRVSPTAVSRLYATAAQTSQADTPPLLERGAVKAARHARRQGTIADVFGSINSTAVLPEQFAALKRDICKDPESMTRTWRSILRELDNATDEIARKGADIIPQIQYADIERGLSKEQIAHIKTRGVVVVKSGVPSEEALAWKQSIKEYSELNADRVRGTPEGNIVFYEIYNSRAQILARTHPALVTTQKALLSLWHNSSPSSSLSSVVSLQTPISYFDRLRIRPPGPSVFTLDPHIDGGSLERWQDEGFRSVFGRILEPSTDGEGWRVHDPFDVAPRLNANQDLYDAPNQCTVFRPWQGWTSLSQTGPLEGTLRVLPMLSLATAYIILRPFFRPRIGESSTQLGADDWEIDLSSTAFPGSAPGKTQELSEKAHPHLKLEESLVSIPRVEPGDQHCDLVHAVESEHSGQSDSSVLYIPAVPLTLRNAEYLISQRDTFMAGLPSPDFPGGEGESHFVGRFNPDDVQNIEARRMLGLTPFAVPPGCSTGERALIDTANRLLF